MSLNRKLNSKYIIKRLLKNHVAPYKKTVFLAIFFMIIVALCTAAIVKMIQPAVDKIVLTQDTQMLFYIPIIMLGIYVIKGIAEYFQGYLIKYVGQKILTNLQMEMYEHLLNSDFLFIQSQSSGRLISRFSNDITLLRGTVSHILVGVAKHLLSVIFLIIIMFSLDPFLSSFVFFVFPLAIYPIQKLGRKLRNVTTEAQEELSDFTAKLDETFSSIKIIKSFCTEKIQAEKAKTVTAKILTFYKRAARLDSLTSPIMEILSGLAVACVLWYGGFSVINKTMTAGGLLAFIMAFVSAYRPFKSLVSLNINLQEGIAASNRVFNILDLKPEIKNLRNAKKVHFNKPEIKFTDLSHTFSNKKVALKNINLTIEAHKTYAFVGRSGSGKTTLANLLIRLFDPTKGNITVNNYNIKEIGLKNLRQQISLVSQDVVLFDDTIRENISYGVSKYSKEEIIKAAKAADAHDFIMSMPQGYDTIVGTAGMTLSGGQRQRLSIARAFLKNAPILLLDEATSSLDHNSEQQIVNSLSELQKNRTTIIITHRLSSIVSSDKIIVLKHGKVVEQGTHNELMKEKKEYYKLYNKELKETDKSV